jgi:hypothetical protein
MRKTFVKLRCFCALGLIFTVPFNSFSGTDSTGIHVSFINLIANPERYDKKLVYLTGYLVVEFENSSFCPSKNTLSTKDCLWLSIDSGPFETDKDSARFKEKSKMWKQFSGKVVSIRGYFDSQDTGHFDGWSGAIRDVVDVHGPKTRLSFDKDGKLKK